MTCLTSLVINGTTIVLFADDMKCLRVISTCNDTVLFQQVLSISRQVRIIAILSRKRNSPVPSLEEKPYTLGGHNLAMVPAQKDLGITVTNKLSCSPQISTIVAKANRMHGFLCKHCSTYIGTNQKTLLYLIFVLSHLSYPSEI